MKRWLGAIILGLASQAAWAEQPQVTAAEAGLVNCTISSVRLEDQLKAANARIAELEKGGEKNVPHPPPAPTGK